MDAALCRVSARGDVRAATRLLALGASADAVSRVTRWSREPLSALGQAARHGHADVVDVLLAAGAHVDVHGCESALVAASTQGHLAIVDRLLAAGANVRAEDGKALKKAARNGHVAVVDRLLRAGADVAERGRFEYSALFNACRQAHLAVVQRFDDASPLSQAERDRALEHACGHLSSWSHPALPARLSLVEWLLQRSANIYAHSFQTLVVATSSPAVLERLVQVHQANKTPLVPGDALLWSCASGDAATVASLLDRPVDPWARAHALGVAASAGHVAVLDAFLQRPAGEDDDQADGLDAATQNGHAALVDWLLLRDPDDDEQRDKALLSAIVADRAALVERLLHGRASEPLPLEALWQAAKRGNLAIMDLLLATGAVDAKADAIALWVACAHGHIDVVHCFLDFGMDASVRNTRLTEFDVGRFSLGHMGTWPSGEPAMVAASAGGHLDVVDLLLDRGARVSAHVPFRQTPLMAACEHGHVAIVERLLQAGADVHAPDDAVRHVIAAVDETHVHPYDLLQEPPAVGAATVFAQGPDAVRDAPIRLASEGGHAAIVLLLLRRGADARKISWDDLALDTWPGVVAAVPRSLLKSLPDDVQPVWVCVHLRRFAPRLRQLLQHVCDRLDRPPREALGAGTPTREELIAHLRTAGRRFAREYWTEGLPLFFPGLRSELGPVPDEFCVRV